MTHDVYIALGLILLILYTQVIYTANKEHKHFGKVDRGKLYKIQTQTMY